MDYGYVLTNHKAQGKDVNFAIGLIDSHHKFSATLKNFYVQISRAVQGMTLITDNKEHLIAAIKRNNDEKLAIFDKFSSQHVINKKITREHKYPEISELKFTKQTYNELER